MNILKKIREKERISMRTLAKRAGVGIASVNRWEKSDNIKVCELKKLLAVMGYSLQLVATKNDKRNA